MTRYYMRNLNVYPLNRLLHGFQDLLPSDVGREYPAPVGIARHPFEGRPQGIIAEPHAGRRAALLDRLHGLAQEPPHLDDRLVGRPQMLFAAVDDAPHAFLDRAILDVDPVDPGQAL